jgi:hypothetical protein
LTDLDERRIHNAESCGNSLESGHEDMHQRRPDVGLIPLLTGLDVTGRDTAIKVVEVVFNTLVGIENSIWIVLEVVGRSTKPEGVELGRTEEDLLIFGSILSVYLRRITVNWEVDLLRL